ncbi:hypothetical protein ACWEWX_40175 [Streptomyces asiaticus]
MTERRRAKVAELKALNRQDAKLLGLEWISERTLERMAAERDAHGLLGLADGRWTRSLSGHQSVTPQGAEAIHAVHAESLHRSRLSMKTKERMIHQYVREKFGPDVPGAVRSQGSQSTAGPLPGRTNFVETAAR